jgi:hypothetical protein
MSGYVYLLRMDDTDYYKVGVSAGDPKIRIATLQTGNPIELHLIAASEQDQPYRIEHDIHDALDGYQVRNEWFKADREVIHRVFRDYTTMATIDTLLSDPVQIPSNEDNDRQEERQNELRQRLEDQAIRQTNRQHVRSELRTIAAEGKGRDYARQWAKDNGFQFNNNTWTEVRRELGLL